MISITGRNSRGLSLIEVLVTVVLLASGAVWVLQAFARSWEASTIAQQHNTAYLFAIDKMGEIELRLQEEPPVEPLAKEGTFRQAPITYQWSWQANPMSDKPPTYAVELVVQWQQGRAHYDERLSTVIAGPMPPKAAS